MTTDHDRDRARTDDMELVRYLARWERSLERLQRVHPRHWSVRGWSEEEVRAALTLRLLEVVRGDPRNYARYEQGGREWALVVVRERLAELRGAHRLSETPLDFTEAPVGVRGSNQEDDWIEAEENACRELARARAESRLSVPQRRWFAAMRMAANGGAFFRASDELNLSAASRVLGKNRSSAQRAYRELQTLFGRELDRLK